MIFHIGVNQKLLEQCQNKFSPKEIIENSVEAHHFKNSNRSKLIYVIILLALITTFLSLPLINIGIYNTSEGLIRANRDRVILQASNSGIVSYYHLETI